MNTNNNYETLDHEEYMRSLMTIDEMNLLDETLFEGVNYLYAALVTEKKYLAATREEIRETYCRYLDEINRRKREAMYA